MQSHHCQHACSLSKELGGGIRLESCNCKYIVKYLRYDAFDGNILNSRYVQADNSSEVHFLHFHFPFEVLLQISWRKVATAPGLAPEALVNQSRAFTAHMLSYHDVPSSSKQTLSLHVRSAGQSVFFSDHRYITNNKSQQTKTSPEQLPHSFPVKSIRFSS